MKQNILAIMTLAAIFVLCEYNETCYREEMPYGKVYMFKVGTPFGNTFAALVLTVQPYSNFPTYTR